MGSPSEIYVKVLPNGDPVQLTHDGVPNKFGPRFSPDGTRVAYSTLGGTGWTTWVVAVLGGQPPRKLLANAEGLTWIPDRAAGRGSQPRVLFSYSTGKGITMAVATATESRSEERTVFLEDGIMEHFSYLSPDGKQLLLAEMGFNGWQPCRVAPFDGSSKGKKVGLPEGQCDGGAWSPDGKWIYLSVDTGSGFHIWRQRFPDGSLEQVTSGATEENGVEFFPDGRSFLTSVGSVQSTLWIHDARGDRQASSDAYSFAGAFSPDGKKLYYLVRTAAGSTVPYGRLWVMELESGQRQRLLPDFQMEQYDISRDEKRVVFISAGETGRQGVWLAPLDGRSAPRPLTSSRGEQAFFGASGEVFFAAQEKDGTFIYRVKEDGSELRKVIAHAILSLYGVSPDGKHIAVWEESSNAVAAYPVDGGTPTIICQKCGTRVSSPRQVTWSRDGKLLYLAALAGQAVYSVPLRAGQILPPLPRAGLQSPDEMAALPGAKQLPKPFAVTGPDPSVYVYPKFTAQRNIYRVPVP
jgi:Tol biopolymer transport system component